MDLKHYEQILSDLHPIGRYLFSPPSSSTTASTRAPLEPLHAQQHLYQDYQNTR